MNSLPDKKPDVHLSVLSEIVNRTMYQKAGRSGQILESCMATLVVSAFFVKEYFPVPSSGGNQCKNRHAAIWHFG